MTMAIDRATALEAELTRLEGLRLGELRAVWQQRYGQPPPVKKSRDVLLRLLAWRMQEEVYGGLKSETVQQLRRLAQAFARDPAFVPASVNGLKPGTELIRDWHGKRHVVHVRADGLAYEGKIYKTLSVIARTITGVRWSGPAFFGLKAKDKQKHR
jgi:hypothetical protein